MYTTHIRIKIIGLPGGRYRYNGLLSMGGVYVTKLRIGNCDT